MRFVEAWREITKENFILKILLVVVSIVAIGSISVAVTESSKEPIVVERSCRDITLKIANQDRTDQEVKAFVTEAVAQRFNSDATASTEFLGSEEMQYRANEQKELATRSMSQMMIVRKLDIHGGEIKLDIDRLISVAEIRSAFPFPLIAQIAKTQRTESNPYGLQVVKFVQPVGKEKPGATK